jgi:TonB family protein
MRTQRTLSVVTKLFAVCVVECGTILGIAAAALCLNSVARAQQNPIVIESMSYPILARTARAQGAVVVEANILPSGIVGEVKVLSGHPLLGEAVARLLTKWRFTTSAGEIQRVKVTFEFRLEGLCSTRCCRERFVFHYPDQAIVTSEEETIQPAR